MKALQIRFVPIHVYKDQPWLPFANLIRNMSYSATFEILPDLISQLSKMPNPEIAKMEQN